MGYYCILEVWGRRDSVRFGWGFERFLMGEYCWLESMAEVVGGFADWYASLVAEIVVGRASRVGGSLLYRKLPARFPFELPRVEPPEGAGETARALLRMCVRDVAYLLACVDAVAAMLPIYMFGVASKQKVGLDTGYLAPLTPGYLAFFRPYDHSATWRELLEEDVAHIHVLKLGWTWTLRHFSRFLGTWALDCEEEYPVLEKAVRRIAELAEERIPPPRPARRPKAEALPLRRRRTVHVRRRKVLEHPNRVWSAAFSPDGRLLATGAGDGVVRLWSVEGAELLAELGSPGAPMECVAFSPDGKLLAAACDDGAVRVWDVGARRLAAALRGHRDVVCSVAFSPDGKLLASASPDGTVRLWRVGDWEQAGALEQGDAAYSLAFSSDGRLLAAGLWSARIKLWNVQTGELAMEFGGHKGIADSLAFSPDGRLLAVASGEIWLWSVDTGKLARKIWCPSVARSVAFSPDGELLAYGGELSGGGIRDVSSGELLATLGTFADSHRDRISSVAFSPDSKLLASASWDCTVRLWELK